MSRLTKKQRRLEDFLGTKTEAEVIAKELGSNAQIPSIDDHTPNAATIDFTGASGKRISKAGSTAALH
jgi:hypothetical protein